MATTEIKAKLTLDGVKEAQDGIKKVGAEGENAAKKIDGAFNKIDVGGTLVGRFTALRNSFQRLGEASSRLGAGFRRMGESFTAIGEGAGRARTRLLYFTAAITGAGYAFERFVSSGLDAVGQLADLSESLNVSVQDLQAFNLAAAQIGVDSNDFSKGIVGLNEALQELVAGSKDAGLGLKGAFESVTTSGGDVIKVYRGIQKQTDALSTDTKNLSKPAETLQKIFAKMGVQLTSNTSPTRALEVLGDYFANVATESEKLGIAVDLVGPKLGPKFVRFLNQGGDALAKNRKLLAQYGVLLSNIEVGNVDRAGDQLAVLGQLFEGFRNKFVAILAPGLIDATSRISEYLRINSANIIKYLADAATNVTKFFQDIVTLVTGGSNENQRLNFPWLQTLYDGLKQVATQGIYVAGLLVAGFTGLSAAMQPVADLMNAIFGTDFSGTGLVLAAVVLQLSGAFVSLGLVVAGLVAIFGGIPVLIGAAILAAASLIYAYWDQIVAGATWAVNGIIDAWSNVTNGIKELWSGAVDYIGKSVSSVIKWISGLVDWISRAISRMATLISKANVTQTGRSDSGATGISRANGGYIRGPGTSISDSIPAWLSNGEFVVKAAAVRKYGVAFLQAINGMRAGFNMKDGFPGFAMGGLVGVPAMAMPSLGGSRSSLTLVLDGQSFGGLSAPADTLSALEKAVRQKRLRATGRGSPYAAR